MKKILGYITVLLVFSWVTTANAFPVAAVTNSIGQLQITGFSATAVPVGDADASTINFLFTYATGTNVTINQSLVQGQHYDFSFGYDVTGVGSFSSSFDMIAAHNVSGPTTEPLATLFTTLVPPTITGAPLSTFVLDGSTLNLLSASFGKTTILGNDYATLLLTTQVTSGTQLNADLDYYDTHNPLTGAITTANNSATTGFTNGNITIPEPATMLLLSAGLLGFGFSRKRA